MTATKTTQAPRGYLNFNEVVRAAVLVGCIVAATYTALIEMVWSVVKAIIQVAS
jgi:hypothetical protein